MQLFKGLGMAIAATAAAFAMMPSASAAAQADTMSAPPAPAAVNCDWNPTKSTTGVSLTTTKEISLRYGPAASCPFIGWDDMDVPTLLWAVCKYRNPDSGNTWYYTDPNEASWARGWIYSGNVKVGSGTIPSC
ncbi:hypothetical protein QF034_000015 [Streptomyces africanus]|uniref:Uncharacterized protein n=2 Tax=Streptomyces africanus TaxID=231024 RepID=A0ABU0QGT8_9ACTN|nr:hypothetical protein [Streptomyces africanus]